MTVSIVGLFCLGATSGDAQGFLLAQLSVIIPGSSQGTICDARYQTQVSHVQDKCLTLCPVSQIWLFPFTEKEISTER